MKIISPFHLVLGNCVGVRSFRSLEVESLVLQFRDCLAAMMTMTEVCDSSRSELVRWE